MITLECLLDSSGKFIVAKRRGWLWSADERREFVIISIDVDMGNIPDKVRVGSQDVDIAMLGLQQPASDVEEIWPVSP